MKVESAKKWYLYTSNKIVTISKEMHKTHVEKAYFLLSRRSNEVSFFRKECNELQYL
jgi:hypothetical protein